MGDYEFRRKSIKERVEDKISQVNLPALTVVQFGDIIKIEGSLTQAQEIVLRNKLRELNLDLVWQDGVLV